MPAGVANAACVHVIQSGESLSLIADALDQPGVSVASLQTENEIADPDLINRGGLLDICVGNGVDDVTGDPRTTGAPAAATPTPAPAPAAPADWSSASGVEAQQEKLNSLFASFGTPTLAVDGDSGPLTRQQLCAARLALGLPASRTDMAPGSEEERTLMAATGAHVPAGADVDSDRWALIDKTCQIMFVGAGDDIVFVFPTSTGQEGYETPDQDASRAFRFDPALENAGWHNSTAYPAAVDNPLNGNMYKPVYFNRGQAIHGANNVPPAPASKGCARLHVEDQDRLLAWLGLADADGPVWSRDRIDLTVTVQGDYVA
jgi:lipoprotein-anchoring transpeptidase ErfK/SrfK